MKGYNMLTLLTLVLSLTISERVLYEEFRMELPNITVPSDELLWIQ